MKPEGGMQKLEIDNNVYLCPMPIVLVGTMVEGKANFMTVGWVSRVNFNPPMIAISINRSHYTPEGIQENRSFSINIPGRSMLEVTDYCGLVSGKTIDKSKLFELFYGRIPTAPMVGDCPLNMECKLVQAVDLPSNYLFIGEIVGAYCEERVMTDGKPDIKKIDPLVLSMPDTSYWGIGEFIAKAWNVGKEFKKADGLGTKVFEAMYKGVPPWEIDGPQSEIVHLVEHGEIKSAVLDVGCGTGENALYLAEIGFEVAGIDIVTTAIEKALSEAKERSLAPTFLVWDALGLQHLERRFNTVIDSGFFHVLPDEKRPVFVESLASVLNPGGTYFMICFSEHEPGSWGPRRVTQTEIRESFRKGWQINYIREAKFDTNRGPRKCNAWLSSITLIDSDMVKGP